MVCGLFIGIWSLNVGLGLYNFSAGVLVRFDFGGWLVWIALDLVLESVSWLW